MNRRHFLLGAAGVASLQAGAVGAMIVNRANKITNGKEVILRSAMVDPRDLFRGHYVTLNLDVGNIAISKVNGDYDYKYDDEVFVALQKGDGLFWEAKSLSKLRPVDANTPLLRGTIARTPGSSSDHYRVSFPFDRYFAPYKRAKELEVFRSDQNLGIVLAVDKQGNGYIKGVTVAGELIYDEPLY